MNWRSAGRAAFLLFIGAAVVGSPAARAQGTGATAQATAAAGAQDAQQKLLDEGENKFHANCGRCHQPPHHLPPRLVLTVERHMRVRATLTPEDMKAIIAYLTQ